MKSWGTYIFIQFFLFITINLHSQHLNCDSIQLEDLICDFELLDGFTGTMNTEDSGGLQPNPLCYGSGEADNIIWFGFIAREGDYEIVLSFESCEAGILEAGIQVGVYTDCTFTESIFCNSGSADTLDKVIPSSLFQPGQDYYLFIDGFANTMCDYKIDIVGTFENSIRILGSTFIDYNANGIRNVFEPALENVNISIDPGGQIILSDSDGYFSFEAILGESYTLTASISEGEWIEDEVSIDITDHVMCDNVEIGFVPIPNGIPEAEVNITNSIARCDWETKFYIKI